MSRLGFEMWAPQLGEGPSTSQRNGSHCGPHFRAGEYAFRCRNLGNTAETRAYDVSLATSAAASVTKSTTYRSFYFRINNQFPTADNTVFALFGASSDAVCLTVNTDGTIKLRNLGVEVAFPGELLGTVGIAQLDTWHRMRVLVSFKSVGPPVGNDPGGGVATAQLDDGSVVGGASGILTGAGQGIGWWQGGLGRKIDRDRFGRPSGSGDVDLDVDFARWICDDAAMPDFNTLTMCPASANGTYQEWTASGEPDWRARNIWPDITTSGLSIASAVNGARQSYFIDTTGVSGTILCAVAHIYFTTFPGTRPSIILRRNGAETIVSPDWSLAAPDIYRYRFDVTGWSSGDTFELGVRLNAATSCAIGSLALAFEHTGGEPGDAGGDVGIEHVTWTGNGTAQSVATTRVPDIVIWYPRTAGQSGGMWVRGWAAGHHFTNGAGGAYRNQLRAPDQIARLDICGSATSSAQGPNVSGTVYDAMVISDPSQRLIALGAVSQNNSRDNTTIPYTLDSIAEVVIACMETRSTGTLAYRGPGHAGDNASLWPGAQAQAADRIQAINSSNWQMGTGIATDVSQTAWLALRTTGFFQNVLMATATYTGNGAGGLRTIALSLDGRTPDWVIVKPLNSATPGIRNSHMSEGKEFDGSNGGSYANSIQTLGTDSIQVGTALNANAVVYSVLAFSYGEDLSVPNLSITQTFLEVLTDEDGDDDPPPTAEGCVGGGTVANGVNFVDGQSLAAATQIHVWLELTVGATVYRWAKVAINADERKQPRVLSFGRLVRALTGTRGGFETPAVEIMLSDVDRLLRTLHDAGTLQNAIGKIYMADITTIASTASPPPDPWLLFVGVVRDFRPEGGLQYSITFEDKLTYAFGAFGQERKLPETLVDNRISDQNPLEKVHGTPCPLLYGALSDEDLDEPEGTVPCPMINAITLSGHEELGNIYRFLVGKGVTTNIQAVFRADPLSGTPPTERSKAAGSEYGDKLWAPWQDGWIYDPDQFDLIDSASRFTFIYMDQTHPGAELGRQGRIPIAVNCCGYDTVGDGTGDTISSLPLQLLHFLNNFVAQSALADWLSIATLDGTHSLFDTDSFDTVKSITEDRISGGYVGAFLIGHSRKQITLRELLAQFCRSGDFDLGVNRYGQLFITMLDRSSAAAGAAVFTAQDDILEGTFRIDPKADEVENVINYVYRRRYVETLQQLTPAEGAPGLREPFDAEWIGQPDPEEDAGAITALGQRRPGERLELEMIRDADVALDVAEQRLARLARPRAEATFSVRCNRGMSVELGDIIKITHFGGLGASGWTARRCQVRRHEVDLDALTVTITARDVHNLMA